MHPRLIFLMGYYHIPVDKETQKLTMITIGNRQYSYQQLGMGIGCAPDIFQSVMTDLFSDLSYVLVYIDDILCLQEHDKPDEEHFRKLRVVLDCLESKGF